MIEDFVAAAILVIGSVGFLLVLAAIGTVPTWLLWNWLMPEIFGLKTIGFLVEKLQDE